MLGTRRYPRAYAAWHLQFKFQLNLPFVHSLLMLHVPPDDGLIQSHRQREKPWRPPHRSPVRPLQLGIPEPQLPTHIRFHLTHNTRDRIFLRYHQHHVDMVNLHTPLLCLHIGMILLNLWSLFLHNELDGPPQIAPSIFWDPHHMLVMLIGPIGTEANLHALVSSKTPHVARSPPPPAGSAFTHGLTPVVLRAGFDSSTCRKKQPRPLIYKLACTDFPNCRIRVQSTEMNGFS